MSDTVVRFNKERNGYSKEQVEAYVKKIADAYQSSYEEYQTLDAEYRRLQEKYEEQLRENRKLKDRAEPEMDAGVVAKALINAETLAQKTLAEARQQAEAMLLEAKQAQAEAAVDAGKLKEAAGQIIEGAKAEAAVLSYQARASVELAQKTLEKTVLELSNMLHSA